jgi:exopolysaccharide biosynthesis polyprenyl glycosylphosphotransferase
MQQSLTDQQTAKEFTNRRRHRPGLMKRAQIVFVITLVLIDIGCTWLSYFGAYWLMDRNPDVVIGPFTEFWPLPVLNTILVIAIFFTRRMYQRRRPIGHLDEMFKIFLFTSLAILFLVAILALAAPDFEYHRTLLFYAWLINIVLLTIARSLHAQIQWQAQAHGVGDDRVLLIGTGEVGRMLLQKILSNPKMGYQMIGVVGKVGADESVYGIPVLGGLADIPSIIETHDVDEVIIGLPESSHQELVSIISLCEREKVGIRVFPDVFQIMASEVSIGDLGGLPLLTIRDVALQGWKLTLKRGMDILFTSITLVFASPFLLLTAILVKLDSPGPVFHVQERMGLDAKPFKIIKFRSMKPDAEQAGPGWTVEDDPRRTKVGTIMRRFNIDELPQLINILVGDMSLVGPRPERPVYVEQFRQSIPRYMDRHREKAGLTGWAQVNGLRGDTSIMERTKYDLWYIENWSLALDIKIILRTLGQTLLGSNRNAY